MEKNQKQRKPRYIFYVARTPITVHVAMLNMLLESGNWKESKRFGPHVDLLIGGHSGKGIPFKQFQTASVYTAGGLKKLVTNYFCHFPLLCDKAKMIWTLRKHCRTERINPDSIMPQSFVICQQKSKTERQDFIRAFKARQRQIEFATHNRKLAARMQAKAAANSPRRAQSNSRAKDGRPRVLVQKNIWIIKPSGGACGNDIVLCNKLNQINSTLTKSTYAAGPVVIQKYVERPLTLKPFNRKFDMRTWVLVTPAFEVCVYRQGVLRTACEPFTLKGGSSILQKGFVHLTNHSVQKKHPNFCAFEEGNEMLWNEFDSYLREYHPGTDFYQDIYPQMCDIVATSMQSVQSKFYDRTQYYQSFQLFGFDFMVTQDFKVTLLEINSSPAVAERLIVKMAQSIVGIVIDSRYPAPGRPRDRPQDSPRQYWDIIMSSSKKPKHRGSQFVNDKKPIFTSADPLDKVISSAHPLSEHVARAHPLSEFITASTNSRKDYSSNADPLASIFADPPDKYTSRADALGKYTSRVDLEKFTSHALEKYSARAAMEGPRANPLDKCEPERPFPGVPRRGAGVSRVQRLAQVAAKKRSKFSASLLPYATPNKLPEAKGSNKHQKNNKKSKATKKFSTRRGRSVSTKIRHTYARKLTPRTIYGGGGGQSGRSRSKCKSAGRRRNSSKHSPDGGAAESSGATPSLGRCTGFQRRLARIEPKRRGGPPSSLTAPPLDASYVNV